MPVAEASNSRIVTNLLPTMCSPGPRLPKFQGLFRSWMAQHFADVNNIDDPYLHKLIYSKDVKQTGIVIESNLRWDPRVTEGRPSIIVKRNSWHSQRMGVDDRMMGQLEEDGGQTYANFWLGSHTLFCVVAEAGGQVERLATEVFMELNNFGPIVRRDLGLFRFQVTDVGEVAKLEEARETFVVPITVGYALLETWRIKGEAPLFQVLDLNLEME